MLEATAVLPRLRSILSISRAYELFWSGVGGPRCARAFSEEYVRSKPGDLILDIGCGPGTILPFLPKGTRYTGFDVSPAYIESARKRFPEATFLCERISEYTLPQRSSYDAVLASGILHHVDDDEARQLFSIAREALKPGGKLVTIDPVFTEDQSPVARYLLQRDRGEFVREREGYERIASSVFAHIEATVRHDLLRIPYTHVILECVRD
jgi:SAM-dependent methyltransferase